MTFTPELTALFRMKRSGVFIFFDRVLAITLLKDGVKNMDTRNVKDFVEFDFVQLVNPIDG